MCVCVCCVVIGKPNAECDNMVTKGTKNIVIDDWLVKHHIILHQIDQTIKLLYIMLKKITYIIYN